MEEGGNVELRKNSDVFGSDCVMVIEREVMCHPGPARFWRLGTLTDHSFKQPY